MFCKNCGKEVKDGSEICSNCGLKYDVTKDDDLVGYRIQKLRDTILEISSLNKKGGNISSKHSETVNKKQTRKEKAEEIGGGIGLILFILLKVIGVGWIASIIIALIVTIIVQKILSMIVSAFDFSGLSSHIQQNGINKVDDKILELKSDKDYILVSQKCIDIELNISFADLLFSINTNNKNFDFDKCTEKAYISVKTERIKALIRSKELYIKQIKEKYKTHTTSEYNDNFNKRYKEFVSECNRLENEISSSCSDFISVRELQITEYSNLFVQESDEINKELDNQIKLIAKKAQDQKEIEEKIKKQQEKKKAFDMSAVKIMMLREEIIKSLKIQSNILCYIQNYSDFFSNEFVNQYEKYCKDSVVLLNAFTHIVKAVQEQDISIVQQTEDAEKYAHQFIKITDELFERFTYEFKIICCRLDEMYIYQQFEDSLEDDYNDYEDDENYESQYNNENECNNLNFFNGCKTIDELKKRYKALSRVYHPDCPTGDEEIMKNINNEFDRLKEELEK